MTDCGTGDDANDALRRKWDARYQEAAAPAEPALVLRDNLHLLPPQGRALEVACGLGGNALALARHGLAVSAWDLSPVAIKRLRGWAAESGLAVDATVRDVLLEPPPAESFDVLVVTHFLDRPLAPALAAALRPNGLLFYQTFSRESVSDCGPSSADFRLAPTSSWSCFRT